jgi:hypothetical protein
MRFLGGRLLAILMVALTALAAAGVHSAASAAYRSHAATSWVPNGTVYAMAQAGSRIYLGGTFTRLTNPATGASVQRSRLAAVDAITGAPLNWNPGANDTVRALAVGSDGVLYAGGAFTSAAGTSASRLAAITPTGTAVSGWKAEANNTVRDIVVDSTGVFVAGAFGTINGTTRQRLGRIEPATGAVDTSFDARVRGGRVHTIAVAGDSLLLGGTFSTLSGAARGASGSVARSTGAVTSWAPTKQCDKCNVLDIATDGTQVYQAIAGPGGRIVAFSSNTAGRVWSKSADGDVQAVGVRDGVVYAGGHFSTFTKLARRQLVALSPTNGALFSFTIAFTGSDYPGVWAITADSNALRIGGGFKLAKNPAARYAAFPTRY